MSDHQEKPWWGVLILYGLLWVLCSPYYLIRAIIRKVKEGG